MKFRYEVSGEDMSLAGKASGEVKRALGRLGVNPAAIKRTAVCMYEAEMNIVIHSHGGQMALSVTPEAVSLRCSDTGPGIPNIDQAMQEGFSTAPSSVRMMGFGAGMGLPNIKRNSDTFDIRSGPAGTTLSMSFGMH